MSTQDPRPLPSQERLRELFDYDPASGHLTRKARDDLPRRFNTRWAGKVAGKRGPGHSYVTVDGELYLVHRVVYKWLIGKDALGHIDHINCDPSDNRFDNLRVADKRGNSQNRPLQRNNTSGHRGVCWDAARGRWIAKIKIAGNAIQLGRFVEFDAACRAYEARARAEFGEFYHHCSAETKK